MGLHAVNDDLATTVLAAHPIRSLEEFCFRKDDAGEINDSNETKLERLKEQLRNVGWESLATPPLQNKYYTIIEACLVAMATEIERRITSRASMSADNIVSQLSRKELWISLEDLIPAIDGLLWDQCPGRLTIQGHSDHGAAHHLNSRPTTAEFQQVKVLEKQLLYDESACIKEHSINKKIYYELSSVGYKRAREIQRRNFPAANGYYYRSLLETTLQVDEKFQGFCIAVDDREGGGTDNKAFHDMMNWIQLPKAAYFVGRLPVGDFWIFTSTEENPEVMDRLLPIFFERKTLADFVDSMKDSRLEYQPVGMRKARHVVGYESSRGVIIVEGMFEKATTKDGFVGQSEHGVKKDDILKKIDQLKSNGFEFIFSPSREHTMLMFPLWAQKAVQDFHSGRTKARLTYEQFIQKFNQVTDEDIVACTKLSGPPEIDWSLTSPLVAPDTGRQESDYRTQDGRWSKTALSKECEARGIQAKSKTMDIMISRLVGPRPPPLIAERMKADIYCPEHDGSASALLVALYLHETTNTSTDGMTKADLIVKAAYLFISESFTGKKNTEFRYLGWSRMPSLVRKKLICETAKNGRKRYKLTRHKENYKSGYSLASQIHAWCHKHGNCHCGTTPDFDYAF
jgi:ERCC4-type nuclease